VEAVRALLLARSLGSLYFLCVCVLSVDAGVGFYVHIHPLSDITAKDNQEKPFEHFRSPPLRRQRIANLQPRPLCFLSLSFVCAEMWREKESQAELSLNPGLRGLGH
jgi:hypothetical protein